VIDGKDHTLEEDSRYSNVTRERIRQIEAKASENNVTHPLPAIEGLLILINTGGHASEGFDCSNRPQKRPTAGAVF
jgi:hypothetical protein